MRYLILWTLRAIARPLTRYAAFDPANPHNIIDRISMTVLYTCAIFVCLYAFTVAVW